MAAVDIDKMSKLKLTNLILFLSIFLVILLIINVFLTTSINLKIKKEAKAIAEKARPAKIELKVIEEKSCAECNISAAIDSIKKSGLNITSEQRFDSSEAKELIQKYNITKLPAMIISGEIEKSGLALEKRKDALVYIPTAPYFDIEEEKIKGLVELTIIRDFECTHCYDIDSLTGQIKDLIKVTKERAFDLKEKEANEIINKYNITKIPTLILSKDAILYPVIAQAWNQIGTIESDGSLVFRAIQPPYLDLKEKRIRGLVNLIMLNDSSCSECYDVQLHRQIIKNLGLVVVNETIYDISSKEGKEIITKYNITKVPTIVLSGDVSVYSAFNQVWQQVGNIESNETYVFRNMEAIKGGIYRDLENDTIIGK